MPDFGTCAATTACQQHNCLKEIASSLQQKIACVVAADSHQEKLLLMSFPRISSNGWQSM